MVTFAKMRPAGRLAQTLAGALIGLAALSMSPASAQQAADQVRVALTDPIETTLLYNDTKPENQIVSDAIYDNLLCYDHDSRKFVPLLAASWRRPDDLTLEFKLRRDVTFHDGTPFTADDVVYTLNWARDPASRLRFAWQPYYLGWIARVEKVDRYTVRVVAKQPTPYALMRFATFAPIVEARLHKAAANKAAYGRDTPVGTGPYQVVSFSSSTGVVLKRNPHYPQGSPCKPAAHIANVRVLSIPDVQTQIAKLMVGELEIPRGLSKDEVDFLRANPKFEVTAVPDSVMHLLQIDAAGRSGNAALTKLKVRQAIAHAINRDLVSHSVEPGNGAVHVMDALCVPAQTGCEVTAKPPAYDPAKARALLKEAGYPSGFDTVITAIPGAYDLEDAVAGELRKVGIRAQIDHATFAAFRRKQNKNQIQLYLDGLPIQSDLDASTAIDYMFDKTARNYTRDPQMTAWTKEALYTLDPEKRSALYRKINDRNNDMVYVLPICSVPDIVVHPKNLTMDGAPDPKVFALSALRWQ